MTPATAVVVIARRKAMSRIQERTRFPAMIRTYDTATKKWTSRSRETPKADEIMDEVDDSSSSCRRKDQDFFANAKSNIPAKT
jgi:hypothetical protein